MKCEKCGHENSEFDILCEECGSPLSIEKNVELQLKYNHKQRAIDIEEMQIDNTKEIFEDTKKKVSSFLIVVFFFLFVLLTVFAFNIYKDYKSSNILNKYDNFMDNNTIGIIYLGEDKTTDKMLEEYSKEYEFNYLYINDKKITSYKKNKIKNNLKLDKINNTIVIVNNKETINFIHNYKEELKDKLILLLQDNKVLPAKLDKAQKTIIRFDNLLKSEDQSLVYINTIEDDKTKEHESVLKDFCKENYVNYIHIDGMYLTEKQQIRLLQKVDYNNLQGELIVIIENKKVIDTIETMKNNKDDYFDLLSTYGIIDSTSSNSLKKINYDQLKPIINSSDKNIILITSNSCEYCGKVKPIIGRISLQNNITFYQIDVTKNIETTEQYLNSIGYNEKISSTPVILITENGKILDYITGLSDKKIYEDTFKEYGIIR